MEGTVNTLDDTHGPSVDVSTVTASPAHGDATAPDPDIRWHELPFGYRKTDHMYIAHTCQREKATIASENGHGAHGADAYEWMPGKVVKHTDLKLSPASAALNYAQIGFEGLKAMRTPTGRIVLFRPEANAQRMRATAAKLAMPPFPDDWFVQAVDKLVRKEARFVPPFHQDDWPETCPAGSRSLYIRPVMLGSGPMLGVSPAEEYLFYIFVSPVGAYRKPGKLLVLDSTHRAPAYGMGDVKAAGNYPVTLSPYLLAQKTGCADVLYLDARHDTYIEEVGSSNFFAVLRDGTIVTPRQGSILPGITRDSIITIARQLCGWRVVERDISLNEVFDEAVEVFYTGTAAVLVEVTHIRHKGQEHPFAAADDADPRMKALARTLAEAADPSKRKDSVAQTLKEKLQDIQFGRADDIFGWMHTVCEAGSVWATTR